MQTEHEAIVQFNLRTILVAMAFVALTCTAFVHATSGWQYVIDGVTCLAIGGGLVASVACSGSRRVFWFALVVFATLYLAATYGELEFLGVQDGVVTSEWINYVANSVHPTGQKVWDYRSVPVFPSIQKADTAARIGLQAMALGVGLLAAYISRAIYMLAQNREDIAKQKGKEKSS